MPKCASAGYAIECHVSRKLDLSDKFILILMIILTKITKTAAASDNIPHLVACGTCCGTCPDLIVY